MSPASSPIVASSNHPLRSPRNDRSPRPGSGHTGSTALVLSDKGRVLGRGYREFTQHFPSPGEVEHDAEEILRVTLEAAREAIKQAGVTPDAIGITNQRETVCAWERETGRPVHRAIVWQDRRTAARCAQLEKQKKGALV